MLRACCSSAASRRTSSPLSAAAAAALVSALFRRIPTRGAGHSCVPHEGSAQFTSRAVLRGLSQIIAILFHWGGVVSSRVVLNWGGIPHTKVPAPLHVPAPAPAPVPAQVWRPGGPSSTEGRARGAPLSMGHASPPIPSPPIPTHPPSSEQPENQGTQVGAGGCSAAGEWNFLDQMRKIRVTH